MPTADPAIVDRLPIKLDSASNGEYEPLPLAREHHHANHLALEAAGRMARHKGQTRRDFLVSACGAASTLLSMNEAYAAAGKRGGAFDVPRDAAADLQLARSVVDGEEFIFDVQGHFVNPTGAWTRRLAPAARPLRMPKTQACAPPAGAGELGYLQCLNAEAFIKDVFLDSDTDLMVLSFVPSTRLDEPLTIEEAQETARVIERLDGTHRLYLHGRVNPNSPGDLEAMEAMAARFPISAWKTYTQWGPDGQGFFLDDEIGLRFIEKAVKLGVRNIAIHKGLPFGMKSYEHSTCVDIGRVARRYPKVNFLIYHSGFVAGKTEGPYDETRRDGIDALVTSLAENGIRPGSNVYAELGSTWRLLMRDPDSAAHALGKLFRAVGEDNVLWGTDSIWYGSPQDQIQAFRTFQIAPALRERYGYPAMTKALRAKVFGLNALKIYPVPAEVLDKHVKRDRVAKQREQYRQAPDPSFATYGPKTRREFLYLRSLGG
ncbi:MAG TPA: amidohydrolase family protein [Usitatibacteraceae bacterium]|nr:amidohydrolase family protein [Usitatibacteraceae bacterium]